ncbi:L,D-transpeptidase family protein [Thalassotalea nanhaiensis]|uniref:L,D-transpeptidase family protein n=1 Tax=Thalassotalea nanhaiensis TaxID=3065648 RepID=A0ABY9TF67_9GAMM|nr:L,D-transpeptidase family protein [Colwelliaceae bacterium SQ345]
MKASKFKYPLIVLMVVFVYVFASEFINKDKCLDSGGSWNSALQICETESFSSVNLVKVDKSEAKMMLFSDGKLVREYDVVFGANPQGHKQQEGDEKTPEGTYSLDYKKEDSSFYRAMHIDYPNNIDTANANKRGVSAGGFIMIHGQRNYLGWLSAIMQNFNWTDGCIALTNDEMDDFMELVSVGTEIQIEW